ncbi:hypothetical protein [Cohnella zeiphila]|uniref:Uncharacterized protein n=1 Tax=Cohnella zeiphila TaxID=2761120 RepID=A0A7X0VV84_9BACL|nr:hypothetical protein [Cohnella zeiphila]MBB6731874.1 hypothetical protein [Cohnella zeiphila]
MELDEQTTNLIREYVYVNVFIEGLKNDALPELKEARVALRDMIVMMIKGMGREFRDRLKEIGLELRKMGIALWIEDKDDVLYAHVNQRGAKEVFGIKRSIVDDEISKMFEAYMKEKDKVIPTSYKIPKVQREG